MSSTDILFKQKYLKYKNKYLELKNNMKGGSELRRMSSVSTAREHQYDSDDDAPTSHPSMTRVGSRARDEWERSRGQPLRRSYQEIFDDRDVVPTSHPIMRNNDWKLVDNVPTQDTLRRSHENTDYKFERQPDGRYNVYARERIQDEHNEHIQNGVLCYKGPYDRNMNLDTNEWQEERDNNKYYYLNKKTYVNHTTDDEGEITPRPGYFVIKIGGIPGSFRFTTTRI
jgi:hypothetical protein